MTAGGPVLAVGAIVISDGALLMVRRGRDPGRGLWTVPGGRVEPGETLEAAVRREVAEETAVDVEVGPLAGVLEVPGDPHYVVLDYVATVAGGREPTAGHDAAEARWIPLAEVASLPCTPRFVTMMREWGVLPRP